MVLYRFKRFIEKVELGQCNTKIETGIMIKVKEETSLAFCRDDAKRGI